MKGSVAYLIAPVLGFVLAQGIKYLLSKRKNKTWREWFRSGNMPSGHSAVVMSLVTVVLFNEGFTELFAVVAVFAMLTMYDAVVARRSIGEQGTALIRLIEKSPFAKDPMPRVALGHKPLEVAAGAALGIVIGAIVVFFIAK